MGIGGELDAILTGVVAGLVGTLVMDALNIVAAQTQQISRIDVAMIGRMAAGWARGRFWYASPSEMQQVHNEALIGIITHYTVGVVFSVPFVVGWSLLVGGSPTPAWALLYGIATTVASWFFVYPSTGMGAFGRLSPESRKATLSSVANHLFYGVGLAIGIALV
jgi:Protein of unknown function (DUF2938)